jgi:nanoRNase/pAp phosphatase (c-di-AMP/oligoRNAs hydrolase)
VVTSPVYWKNSVAEACLDRVYRFDGHDAKVEMVAIIDPTSQMCSLRSRNGGPDCSYIATEYGGGGHARAAGFRIGGAGLLNVMAQKVFG